jgi:hypothetical protein
MRNVLYVDECLSAAKTTAVSQAQHRCGRVHYDQVVRGSEEGRAMLKEVHSCKESLGMS